MVLKGGGDGDAHGGSEVGGLGGDEKIIQN